MLVVFRVVQAAGAALLTPTSLGLVLATAAPERRHSAVRAWTAVGGIGAALGPVVGGLLVAASWRWVFLVNVPVGLAALAAGMRWLPDVPGHPGPRPDAIGAVLVTGGIGALTLGLVEGRSVGMGLGRDRRRCSSPRVLALVAFVRRCLRDRNPLVPPALFRVRAFTGAAFVATVFSVAFGAMLLSIVLWEQNAWGWSALATGAADRPRAAHGPRVRVPHCRARDRAVGPGPGVRGRRHCVCGRGRLVGPGHRPDPRLRRRLCCPACSSAASASA